MATAGCGSGCPAPLPPIAVPGQVARLCYEPIGLAGPAVDAMVTALRVPEPLNADLGFVESWPGTLSLDGEIAAMQVHGGACRRYPGSRVQAKQLGAAFVDTVVDGRHDRFKVYRSHRAWSPWFHDVAWDSTHLLIDRERAEVTILCVTDTD